MGRPLVGEGKPILQFGGVQVAITVPPPANGVLTEIVLAAVLLLAMVAQLFAPTLTLAG